MWLPSVHATSGLKDGNCNSCSSARSASRLLLSFIIGLQAADADRTRTRIRSPDQDGAEIVDVGHRRTRHDELIQPRKVPVGIIVRQERGSVQGTEGGREAAMVEPVASARSVPD